MLACEDESDDAETAGEDEKAVEDADTTHCPICLVAFVGTADEDPDRAVGRCTLQGFHQFHGYCLSPHLILDSRCPVCRVDLAETGFRWGGTIVETPQIVRAIPTEDTLQLADIPTDISDYDFADRDDDGWLLFDRNDIDVIILDAENDAATFDAPDRQRC
jgi:hypothetical protein